MLYKRELSINQTKIIMKNKILTLILISCVCLLGNPFLTAQESPQMPEYITVTTLYWNMDREASDNDDDNNWMEIEKEYKEKVTMKNEYIQNTGYFVHLYSPTNLETIYVQTYASWADIEKAQERNGELEKEAWPDEAARKAFLDNRNSFYQDFHSDEIMVPFAGAKAMMEAPDDDMVVYVRTSKMKYPTDGTTDEFTKLHTEFVTTTIHQNDKIIAYYPNMHGWGSDRTDFVEAFYLKSMDDLDDMTSGDSDAMKAKWPEEEDRMNFWKSYNKYFTGEHGDAIYTRIAALSK